MLKQLSIQDVEPGMVIVRVTQQHGPVKIKKSGLVTSQTMVQGLAEMGVSEVEVDLDQTVELENDATDMPTNSQTQALLQGQYDRQGHYDNQLADQFNRNLFLPSVQGIPSLWAVYLRQGVVISLTALLGLALGFGLGNPGIFSGAVEQDEEVVAVTDTQDKALSEPEEQSPQVIQSSGSDLTAVQSNVVDEPVVEQIQPDQSAISMTSPSVGDNIINEPQQEDVSLNNVSPELLRRFNRAIEEIDNQAPNESAPPSVTVNNDIQRVDQLPVRLMTTLPSMTFSAHMYATRGSDRWVRVNGQRMQEGDVISDKVQIVAIEPQRVVLSYQDELFSMAALTDW